MTENAKNDEEAYIETLRHVYDLLFDYMHNEEEQKISFSTRKFPWTAVNNELY